MRVAGFAFLLPLAAAGCEGKQRDIGIDFAQTTDGYYQGFRCTSELREPLHPRAYNGQGYSLNLVVDFLELGGTPSCRSAELRTWCEENECAPLSDYRVCIPFEVSVEARENWPESLDKALTALRGTPILEDAPSDAVVLRVVATTQSCAELENSVAFADENLVGCMHSCPAQLDEQDEDLVLDLDVSGTRCWDTLAWCASPLFRSDPL